MVSVTDSGGSRSNGLAVRISPEDWLSLVLTRSLLRTGHLEMVGNQYIPVLIIKVVLFKKK